MADKLLLLDRDDTVTQNAVRPGDYINDPKEIELIPGVLPQLKRYADSGWQIALISNQGGIEKGFLTLEQCLEGFKRTFDLTERIIIEAYFCPESYPAFGQTAVQCGYRGDTWDFWHKTITGAFNCQGFRKPNPDMILLAIAEHGSPQEVLYVGDRAEDRDAANNAGVPFMSAEEWWQCNP